MKTFIKNLKKGDRFNFNGITWIVSQKFSDWKKDGEPYMVANGQRFYFDELEVTKL